VTDRGEMRDATLRDYATTIWRRKWVVISATAVLFGLALAFSLTRTPLYEASAQLMYQQPIDVSNPLSSASNVDATGRQIELDSVSTVIASPDLVKAAGEIIRRQGSVPNYSVSAEPDATTGQTVGSTVTISAISPDAAMAAAAANAYAAAFVSFRQSQQQDAVRQAVQVVQDSLDTYTTEASRLTSDYITIQQRLQDLRILEATVTGNFRVLVPATTPSVPFSPRTLRNALMGLLGGLVVGVLAALLLAQFDTRVRTAEEAAALLGMPVLGRLSKLAPKMLGEQPLYALSEAHSPSAEAMRKLRGNLEFANIDGELDSFFITSCVQHEGKSLTVSNLALSLAATGASVVLVDADLRRPRIHQYLGLPNAVGLSTVLTGRSDLDTALCVRALEPPRITLGAGGGPDARPESRAGLHVLTSGPLPPNPGEIIASKAFAGLIRDLRARFDIVVVDAPALLAVGDTTSIAKEVAAMVFLVDLTRARRPLLIEARAQLSQMPCHRLGMVLLTRPPGRRHEYSADSYYAHADSDVNAAAGKRGRRAPAGV
jgi:polysaccharide biosynthesis transport protein